MAAGTDSRARVAPHITRRLVASYARHHTTLGSGRPRLEPLTNRETEVLRLVGTASPTTRPPGASCSVRAPSRHV
ncbi:hypothetical protein [Streptomyces otsuchiensis]|uniref:hypothetical protein n=1 Tax=Streptomyces otsuchiensis TaxID=2681388 RepID=UPI001D13151F|nr:hypothetical protein [Streptomyces otsuchiensis]